MLIKLMNCIKSYFVIIILIFLLLPTQLFSKGSSNTYYSEQKYLSQVAHSYVRSISEGEGVVVAIIDQGVWLQHPDLIGSEWINVREVPYNNIDDDTNGYVDDYYGWNFLDNNSDLTTKGTHGTGVAGIIAAQDNSIGVLGISPDVKIMPLIACGSDWCDRTSIENAIIYAVDNGADIINLSLGSTNGYVGYSSSYDKAIEYAYNNDVIIIASAGNGDTESLGQVGANLNYFKVSPVSNDVNGINMVLGVGAFGIDGEVTDWSNYGKDVDVLAPGEDIIVLSVPMYDSYGFDYSYASGTSFSAPIVSGAAAMLKSKYPDFKNWEIIDMLSRSYKLNIEDLFRGSRLKCNIQDTKNRNINYGETIRVSGEHFSTNIDLELRGYSQQTNFSIRPLIKFLDAENFEIDTTNLSLEEGGWSFVSSECNIQSNTSFTISGTAPLNIDQQQIELNTIQNNNIDNTIVEEKSLLSNIDNVLSNRLSGKILLQVEKNGEGWYVYPDNKKKYYLGRPADAFDIMRNLGLGIKHTELAGYLTAKFPSRLSGKILLDVEQNGEAYYINPNDLKGYYLNRPTDAFRVMRELGLGITNSDIRKIDVGETE